MLTKAVVRSRYGPPDVLEFKEVERPNPVDDEVLVRVHATSVNKSDMYELNPPLLIRLIIGGGRLRPKDEKIGTDIAGQVEAVGSGVKELKQGDKVFGGGKWSFAEYACARERRLALMSDKASFEEHATLPVAAITALQALRKADVRPGQSVLVDGASGGVGTFAVQIAKAIGAEVTAVCSTGNLDMARSIGADEVIDYTKEDFRKNGRKYDVILQVNGHRSIFSYRGALAPQGTFLMVGSSKPLSQLVQTALFGRLISSLGQRKMGFMGIAKIEKEDLESLRQLLEAGKIKPVIDGRYPLNESADAYRYFREGHAHGKVVVTVGDTPN